MIGFVVRRVLLIPPLLFVVATLSFGLIALIPGDPAVVVAGDLANKQQVGQVRHKLGLDQPLPVRYANYLDHVVHGDLGNSLLNGQSISGQILRYLPNTLELIVASLAFAVVLGLLVGIISAYFRRRRLDWGARGFVTIAQSVPDFVIALILIYFLYFLLRLAPAPIGRLDLIDASPPHVTGFLIVDSVLTAHWSTFGSGLAHMVLPVLTLGIAYSAFFAKTTRAALLPALRSPHVEFARSCGLPEWQVVRYAILAARTPILTYGAILFGTLIGGAAIVETIFNWQGLGQWALSSMLSVDVPAIQGFVLVVAAGTLLVYVTLDVIIALLDPRVTYSAAR